MKHGRGSDQRDEIATGTGPDRVPWHFWVAVAATVGYLLWRTVQLVLWLVGA